MPVMKTVSKTSAKPTKLGALPEWNLTDLYPAIDAPEVKRDLTRAETDCVAFEQAFKGKLIGLAEGPQGGRALAAAVRRYEELEELMGRLISYAGLVYSGNTTDPAGAKFYGDVQERITAASSHVLFFGLELNRIDDAALDRAMADPGARPLPALARGCPQGEALSARGPRRAIAVPREIGDRAWRLEPAVRRDHRVPAFHRERQVARDRADPQPACRIRTAGCARRRRDALAATFKENLRPFALVTNTLAKDKEISDRWRGFADVAASRHLANRVEPEVVEALVAAVRAAYPRLSHRYYALKAQWFGKKRLPHWDRNAPLPQVAMRTIGWDEAQDTVLTAYGAFSPKMASIAERFFTDRWIDAPVRPGKAPGAFSHPTVPSAHPYVLLNYQGKPRDVMTLAHELGHGVHQVLAGHNGALMAPTPLTLAETASVFGEMLTFRKLLADNADAKQRKAMLAAKVEDMINTVVRQIAFYTFERKVHLERRNGELTADQLGEIWLDVQRESLGPAIELKPGYETFWTYIPHFIHSPFYVYAYAFGDCLVNSLYAVYENAQDGFAERYLAMLAAGGTKHHSELLKPFGLDARDPAFWQGGLERDRGDDRGAGLGGWVKHLLKIWFAIIEPVWADGVTPRPRTIRWGRRQEERPTEEIKACRKIVRSC